MNLIIEYFEHISSFHRGLILAGGIAVFWIIESLVPAYSFRYYKLHHAGINIFFTITTIIVNFCMAFMLLYVANLTVEHHFGILNWLGQINIWIYSIVGLLLLDFIGAYMAHLVQHKIPVLWKFHLIHHTDTWIDTTSANRHHPGESFIRFIFTALGVLIVGAPMWMVFLYQSMSVVFSQFNHANISLPESLDKWVSKIIVTPNMHKVHHHYLMPYTDTNYGNIFSIWDRLFGTFSKMKSTDIVFGVDTHLSSDEHNSLKNLLLIPFKFKK